MNNIDNTSLTQQTDIMPFIFGKQQADQRYSFIIREETVNQIIDFDIEPGIVDKFFQTVISDRTRFASCEKFYITAIKNLIKKNNYFQILIDLAEKNITEEEFDQEVDNYPEKYLINVEYLTGPDELKMISQIVKKIGLEFSVDEVAELFSLDSKNIVDISGYIG